MKRFIIASKYDTTYPYTVVNVSAKILKDGKFWMIGELEDSYGNVGDYVEIGWDYENKAYYLEDPYRGAVANQSENLNDIIEALNANYYISSEDFNKVRQVAATMTS
jgi:hypothetical protein